ncbi:MAG: dUTP diphosphatase, partial [Candidatus Pacebacteria bacterium]|nr:dUTP diphosphatase [Candidatus Paceibacterota bacterium]
MQLKVKKLNSEAKLPTHGHPGDAGMDFFTIDDVVFPPGQRTRVHTGLSVEIPEGFVGLMWDKSSVSFNMGLKVLSGVIDAGYRGELIMCLLNTSDKEVFIPKGHKVAQMLIQKFEHCDILEVDELSDTVRGGG